MPASAFITALGILASCVFTPGQQRPRADLVITGINVIDLDGGPTRTFTVVVDRGSIVDLLPPEQPVPEADAVIEGRGKFLIPGLWDMHVHLATRPEPSLAENIMFPLFLANGVVGVRDMGGPLDRVLALRAGVNEGRLQGPRIITPGPFIDGSGDADPMFRRAATAEDARTAVRELVKAGVDFVKVQANLTRASYDAVIAEARAQKIVVSGHVPVALSAAHTIGSGQRSIEHISPALPGDAGLLFGCSSREDALRAELLPIERGRTSATPEAIRARETALRGELVRTFDPARAATLGARLRSGRTWIVPTLIWSNSFRPLHREANGADLPLEFVPAQTRKGWQDGRARYLQAAPPEAFTAASEVADASARAVGALHGSGARILAGTDTFDAFVLPGVSLHQELVLLTEAGLTPLAALQTATRNAADFHGTLDSEGTISRGKKADLVILDADPLADIRNASRIHAVITRGRTLTRAGLDKLLQTAREAAR